MKGLLYSKQQQNRLKERKIQNNTTPRNNTIRSNSEAALIRDPQLPYSHHPLDPFDPFFINHTLHQATANASTATPHHPDSPRVAQRLTFSCYCYLLDTDTLLRNLPYSVFFPLPPQSCSHQLPLAAVNSVSTTLAYSFRE